MFVGILIRLDSQTFWAEEVLCASLFVSAKFLGEEARFFGITLICGLIEI